MSIRLEQAQAQLQQAHRAFLQRPEPRLATAMKQLAGVVEYERRSQREAVNMKTWNLFWAPEGRQIAVVWATSASAAIRKAPQPYRQYLGEIYAEEV